MDDRIDEVVVTLVAASEPLDREAALSLLRHVDDYEVPGTYSNRLTNVDGLDPDLVETGQVLYADHVPTSHDVTTADPNVFYTTHEDDHVQVAFRADYDVLSDFTGAVDHVLSAVELTVERLAVAFDVDCELAAEGDLPADCVVQTGGHPDGGRTAANVLFRPTDPLRLTDSAAPVDDRVATAVDHVEGRLPQSVADCSVRSAAGSRTPADRRPSSGDRPTVIRRSIGGRPPLGRRGRRERRGA